VLSEFVRLGAGTDTATATVVALMERMASDDQLVALEKDVEAGLLAAGSQSAVTTVIAARAGALTQVLAGLPPGSGARGNGLPSGGSTRGTSENGLPPVSGAVGNVQTGDQSGKKSTPATPRGKPRRSP
jgi:hypothetical protein